MLDIEPLLAAVEAFSTTSATADRAQLLAGIRGQLEELKAADQQAWAALEEASKGGAGAAEAAHDASASCADESTAARALRSRILSLQRYLTGTSPNDDPEAYQLLQKAVNVAIGYIAGYPDVRDHLIRLDPDRPATAGKVLRARPAAGEVDHAALTREIIARFPNILAELAK